MKHRGPFVAYMFETPGLLNGNKNTFIAQIIATNFQQLFIYFLCIHFVQQKQHIYLSST